jgi:hypothetical protein
VFSDFTEICVQLNCLKFCSFVFCALALPTLYLCLQEMNVSSNVVGLKITSNVDEPPANLAVSGAQIALTLRYLIGEINPCTLPHA